MAVSHFATHRPVWPEYHRVKQCLYDPYLKVEKTRVFTGLIFEKGYDIIFLNVRFYHHNSYRDVCSLKSIENIDKTNAINSVTVGLTAIVKHRLNIVNVTAIYHFYHFFISVRLVKTLCTVLFDTWHHDIDRAFYCLIILWINLTKVSLAWLTSYPFRNLNWNLKIYH